MERDVISGIRDERSFRRFVSPVVDLTPLPADARLVLEQLALHEAGHAVAAIALRFELGSISITTGPACSSPYGETVSTACDVRPESGDRERKRQAAMVWLAGREAHRRRFPDTNAEASWCKEGEHADIGNALRLLGAQPSTPPETIATRRDPGLMVQLGKARESFLAPVTEATRRLLMVPTNWKALEMLVALLMERVSSDSVPLSAEERATVFSSKVRGEDARNIILSAGVKPTPLNQAAGA